MGAIAICMLLPALWSFTTADGGLRPLLLAYLVTQSLALVFAYIGRGSRLSELKLKETFFSVILSWLVASAAIGIPYYFCGAAATWVDALFEGVSGFTTTGASIFDNLERIPRSILLWRCFSQWIGGVGIIVLVLAVFPVSGASIQLYKAEISGPMPHRLTPRIQETAIFLCKTYIALTATQICFLLFGGELSFFDALTLSLSTIATGGFSPYPDNVGHFGSTYVTVVTTVFLFLAGANLTFYHLLLVRRSFRPVARHPEFRFYASTFLVCSALISLILYRGNFFTSYRDALLDGFFHSASMLSTCGFFLGDYADWPSTARHLMLLMMFCGGCAISTAGGITCIRVYIVMQHIREEFVRILHPRAVIPTRVAAQTIDAGVVSSCFAFFTAYLAIFMLGFMLLSLFGQDMTTALSGAAATLGNVGPGFGMIGPTTGYAAQPTPVKFIYMALMLCGRLEIFSLLMVFSRQFWRR